MLGKERIAVFFFEIHAKLINTPCGGNVELLIVELGVT